MRAEHFVRCIPVQVKRLEEQRQEPVRQEKYQNNHVVYDIIGNKLALMNGHKDTIKMVGILRLVSERP